MTTLRINRDDDFMLYPTDHVVGLVDSEADLHAAVADLSILDPAPDVVKALHGEIGQHILDAEGDEHGFYGLIARALQSYSIERSNLEKFESALRKGSYVVTVPAPNDQHKAVGDVLARHGGHTIYYYGEWVVIELKP